MAKKVKKVKKVTTIRLPAWLKDKIKIEAKKEGCTPSKFCRLVIESSISELDIEKNIKKELFEAIEANPKGASQSIGFTTPFPFSPATRHIIAILCNYLEIDDREYAKLSKKDNKIAQKIKKLKKS